MPSPASIAPAVGIEDRLAEAIAQRISAPRYNLWFRDHTKFVPVGDGVVVGVPNLYFHDWLQKTFGADVRAAAAEVFGATVNVRFAIDPELFQAQRSAEGAAATDEPKATDEPPAPREKKKTPPAKTDPAPTKPASRKSKSTRRWRSLRDFVVGQCNRVAIASAQSVIDEPGAGANPLVLYGPTGTGKTHLLEGIYGGIRKRHPEQRIVYVKAEDFMNRFVAAMHQGKQAAFRRQFRECHTLLVDDLSFLAGKKATQVEFLHTFDALLAEGCQVVVTCDCHPRLTDDLMPELADRLLGGAIWGVLPPDAQTRLDLLKVKAAGAEPNIPIDVLQFLANNLRGNVRELEGAIHSLRHFARVTSQPVTKDLARDALGELLRHAIRVVRIADVDAAISAALGLGAGTLKSKSKAWSISHARMLAIFLARKHTAATYGEISAYFGNKTHSTAVAAEKRVRGWLAKNESVRAGDRAWKARDLVEKVEREMQK
ncbi:MAG TPA: DnaA/Hda family protein [Gemmataceae bacterium]|nr:DnaA/Hda family protein [Gemmataceae bacterium]